MHTYHFCPFIRSVLSGQCSPHSVEGNGAWRRREPTSAGEPRAPHCHQPRSKWPPSGEDKPPGAEWQPYRTTHSPQWSSAESPGRYEPKTSNNVLDFPPVFSPWGIIASHLMFPGSTKALTNKKKNYYKNK